MTALTSRAAGPLGPARRTRNPAQPPWTRMLWVTWRQHRAALAGLAALFAALAVAMLLIGLHVRAGYAASHCIAPTNSCAPGMFESQPYDEYPAAAALVLRALVVLTGMFLGAPLIAGELERGTFRFAWSQGTTRSRWITAKLVLLALPVAAAACALGLLAEWSWRPYQLLGYASGWPPGQFDVSGITLPGWALLSFAAGALAGVVIGRTVPAIAATGTAIVAVLVAAFWKLDDVLLGTAAIVGRWVPGYLSQATFNAAATPGTGQPAGGWLIRGWFAGPNGHLLSARTALYISNHLPQPGAVGQITRWLARRHVTYWLAYQPAGRFWIFQALQAGILLLVALLLAGLSVWLVRRRA